MDQAELLSIIGSAYDKLVADVAARIESKLLTTRVAESVVDHLVASGMLTTEINTRVEEIVQEKMDDLGPIDKDMVREVCEEVVEASDIDDKINEYMCNNFDISDYESEIKDIVDVDDALESRLQDAVMSCVQDLKFNVEVTSR